MAVLPGFLELEGISLPPDLLISKFSSKYCILTSCNLPEALFATPSWRIGILSPDRESLSRADLLSCEGTLLSSDFCLDLGVAAICGDITSL